MKYKHQPSIRLKKSELFDLLDNFRQFAMDIRKTAEHTLDGNIDRATQNFAHIARTSEQLIYQILFAEDALLLKNADTTHYY